MFLDRQKNTATNKFLFFQLPESKDHIFRDQRFFRYSRKCPRTAQIPYGGRLFRPPSPSSLLSFAGTQWVPTFESASILFFAQVNISILRSKEVIKG